jgi:hypothetical protein
MLPSPCSESRLAFRSFMQSRVAEVCVLLRHSLVEQTMHLRIAITEYSRRRIQRELSQLEISRLVGPCHAHRYYVENGTSASVRYMADNVIAVEMQSTDCPVYIFHIYIPGDETKAREREPGDSSTVWLSSLRMSTINIRHVAMLERQQSTRRYT